MVRGALAGAFPRNLYLYQTGATAYVLVISWRLRPSRRANKVKDAAAEVSKQQTEKDYRVQVSRRVAANLVVHPRTVLNIKVAFA